MLGTYQWKYMLNLSQFLGIEKSIVSMYFLYRIEYPDRLIVNKLSVFELHV